MIRIDMLESDSSLEGVSEQLHQNSFSESTDSSLFQDGQMLAEVYNDYLQFIVAMLTLHVAIILLCRVCQQLLCIFKQLYCPLPIQTSRSTTSKVDDLVNLREDEDFMAKITLKRLIGGLAILLIQYSLIYCLQYLLIAGIASMLNCSSAAVCIQDILAKDRLDSPHMIDASIRHIPGLQSNTSLNGRILTELTPLDVIQVRGSYSLDPNSYGTSYDLYTAPSGKAVQICDNTRLTSLDISYLATPVAIEVKDEGSCSNGPFSSDGLQDIERYGNQFRLHNLLDYQVVSTIDIIGDLVNDKTNRPVLSSDGQNIYYMTFDGSTNCTSLYSAGVYSGEVHQLNLFNIGPLLPKFLKMSADGKIQFTGFNDQFESQFFIHRISDDGGSVEYLGYYSTLTPMGYFDLSIDETMLFLIGIGIGRLETIDVSNLQAPTLISGFSWSGNQDVAAINSMSVSKDNKVLALATTESKVYIFDMTDLQDIVFYKSSLAGNIVSILENNKDLVVLDETTKTLQLGTIYMRSKLVQQDDTLKKPNIFVSSITTQGDASAVILSPDKHTAFVASSQGLEIFTIDDENNLLPERVVSFNEAVTELIASRDGGTIFLVTSQNLIIINATNDYTEISRFSTNDYYNMTISSDNKTLVLFHSYADRLINGLVDITQLDNLIPVSVFYFSQCSNWQLANGYAISIYNKSIVVSSLSDTSVITVCSLPNVPSLSWISTAISSDAKTLYAVGYTNEDDNNKTSYLYIFNTSDLLNSKILGSVELYLPYLEDDTSTFISVTTDLSLAYIPVKKSLYILNVINSSAPYILNFIEDLGNFESINSLAASSNSSYAIALVTSQGHLGLIDLSIYNTLYTPVKTFFVGNKSEMTFIPIHKIYADQYRSIDSALKLVKATSYAYISNMKSIKKSYSALPGWIYFDKENSVLVVQPNSPDSVSSRQLYLAASTQIFETYFDITMFPTPEYLMFILFSLGYLDTENYITSMFNPTQSLKLPSPYDTLEKDIHEIMSSCYYEAVLDVEVNATLQYILTPSFQLTTPSQFALIIKMTLYTSSFDEPQQSVSPCRFVKNLDYGIKPSFDDKNATMYIEGPSYDINQLLKILMIDLEGVQSCDASLSINDYMNPILNQTIPNISDYLNNNLAPAQNSEIQPIQDEVSNIILYTDSYFTFLFDQKRFNDTHLQFAIQEVPWLTLNWPSISGTPPNQFWPSKEVLVKLIVFNEYKSTPLQVTFKVRWGLSTFFTNALKLAGALGSYIYFYLLLNILCQKRYRYPKDLYLKIDTVIPPAQILPIACIVKEAKESRLIIKQLQKAVAKSLNRRSISRAELTNYFVDSSDQQISTFLLANTVQEVIVHSTKAQHSRGKHYNYRQSIRGDLVNQLILNEFSLRQLEQPAEKKTKQIFQELKDHWLLLVMYEEGQPRWKLCIDEPSFEQELQKKQSCRNQKAKSVREKQEISKRGVELANRRDNIDERGLVMLTDDKIFAMQPNEPSSSNLEKSLITDKDGTNSIDSSRIALEDLNKTNRDQNSSKGTQINLGLLKNAILAHAYKQQHLNYHVSELAITVKKRRKNIWWLPMFIARFMKLDLRTIDSAMRENMGYGIRCNIKNDIIYFSGDVDETFEGGNLVVQISKRRRIVRELWFYGIEKSTDTESLLNENTLPL